MEAHISVCMLAAHVKRCRYGKILLSRCFNYLFSLLMNHLTIQFINYLSISFQPNPAFQSLSVFVCTSFSKRWQFYSRDFKAFLSCFHRWVCLLPRQREKTCIFSHHGLNRKNNVPNSKFISCGRNDTSKWSLITGFTLDTGNQSPAQVRLKLLPLWPFCRTNVELWKVAVLHQNVTILQQKQHKSAREFDGKKKLGFLVKKLQFCKICDFHKKLNHKIVIWSKKKKECCNIAKFSIVQQKFGIVGHKVAFFLNNNFVSKKEILQKSAFYK